MNRAPKAMKCAPVAKHAKTAKKAVKATKRTVTTKTKKIKTVSKSTKSTPSPQFSLQQFQSQSTTAPTMVFSLQSRHFGGHSAGGPDINDPSTWGPQEPAYMGVQVAKYGKNKLPKLFQTDTPTFRKTVAPLDFEGKELQERNVSQPMTSEEYCAKFGIVLVDREVAHCQGNVDGPHPQQFIQIHNTTPSKPLPCKYCGTRFVMRSAFDNASIPFQPEH